MKHLHFVQSLEPLQGGGLGRAALELHDQLRRRGEGSTLAATRSQDFTESWPGVLQYERTGPQPLYFARGLAAHARRLVEACDVVHGHGLYVAPNALFGREAARTNRPLVYHVHGFFEPWILNRSHWKKRLVHRLFEDSNFRRARLWRALTMREADQIRAQGITAPIVVAANGIDTLPFDTYAGASAPRQRKRAVFLGRLHPKKGLDLLLPAWAALARETHDWELVIAGPDEGGYAAEVRSLIDRFDLAGQVHMPGPLWGDAKTALLKSADLFLLPSYSEGFSVAILEAMACSVPVLATDACNFPELAREGGGWECAPEADAVRETLRQALHASDDERSERGRAGRRLLDERYTWPSIASQIGEACRLYCADGDVAMQRKEKMKTEKRMNRDAEPAPESQASVDNRMRGGAPDYQRIAQYDQSWYSRGRPAAMVLLWFGVQATVFRFSPHFADGFRAGILRAFGARVGKRVKIRPSVRITYPWRLSVGDDVWIGEEAYLHSLEDITLGNDVVVSQRSFLCTGSHDHRRTGFDLIVKPIRIEAQAWIAAEVFVGPGVCVGRGSVLSARSVAMRNVPAGMLCAGHPLRIIGPRLSGSEEPSLARAA